MDLDKQFISVRRLVKKSTPEDAGADSGRTISITQTFNNDMESAWKACTEPDQLKQWFSPVTGDLRSGGHYEIQNNASGTIESCNRRNQFCLTWNFDDVESRVVVTLHPANDSGSSTHVTLEHTTAVNDHWKEFGAGAGGVGWDMAFAGLASHLEGVKMEPGWFMANSGPFLLKCNSAWCEAAIEGGEEPAVAEEAAVQSKAFYAPVDA